ncbi:uncharacterized mitochondrial protein-like protein [Tanacetum coccineum]
MNFVPTAVATKSEQVPVNTTKQSSPREAILISIARPGNPQYTLQDQGIFDSGCSRHTTGNKPFLTNYQGIDGGFVTFRGSPKGGKISGKVRRAFNQKSVAKTNNLNEKVNTAKIWRPTGKVIDHISKDSGSYMPKRFDYVDPHGRLNRCSRHMTGNKSYLTDYQDIDGGFVAFVGSPKEFNLFSVSQMCDKKNSVLFTETECLVLSPDFKLLDESQVLLKVPRQNNMYSFDLKNVVPSGDLTCLFAKATINESNLWHMRLGHINFKTMNKLVRGNLVRGLPSNLFENDHTCVAYQKGKQHRASYHKVKIIRCDNRTEFKNNDLNQFCGMKGIKREFSVARTPQQNGVAERKNRSLIEAARTMLADSLLPTTFWAEAVNTACYVQNKVLVTKPHNKTHYELLLGRPPSISFMRPFGCPVTILNTLDPLGKFNGKADEGFLVGYSINSKAFRVFKTRTRKVEENLHINFLENKPNVAGSGPEWLFDIDSLTKSMNYEPVTAGNQTNGDAGIETNVNAGQAGQEKASDHEYILLPLMLFNSPLSSSSQTYVIRILMRRSGCRGCLNNWNNHDCQSYSHKPEFQQRIHPKDQIIGDINSATQTRRMTKISKEHAMVSYINKQRRTNHKDYQNCLFACFLSKIEPKKVIQALTDPSWIEAMQEELLQFKLQKVWTLVDLPKGYTQEEGIDYDEVFAPIARIEAIRLFLDYALFMRLIVYQMDVKSAFLYGTIEEETASTPMEPNKALVKDEEAEDVDVHLYRLMIGSLMYLTTSRPDITFAVCACARFQVTPKISHLYAVKRIFRYLKGQPELGLWYPMDSPFDLESFSDSDYAGASLDRKSTTGGC